MRQEVVERALPENEYCVNYAEQMNESAPHLYGNEMTITSEDEIILHTHGGADELEVHHRVE